MKKIKDIFIDAIEERRKHKEELERKKRERNEEEAREERDRIQAKIATLMAMNEKELMVKIVLELEALSARLTRLEKMQKESEYIMSSLDSRMLLISTSIDELKYK